MTATGDDEYADTRPGWSRQAIAQERGEKFMGTPDRWFEGGVMRCDRGHVSRSGIKTERDGIVCAAAAGGAMCWRPLWMAPPEDKERDCESCAGAGCAACEFDGRERSALQSGQLASLASPKRSCRPPGRPGHRCPFQDRPAGVHAPSCCERCLEECPGVPS